MTDQSQPIPSVDRKMDKAAALAIKIAEKARVLGAKKKEEGE